jgi:hypothetical protein
LKNAVRTTVREAHVKRAVCAKVRLEKRKKCEAWARLVIRCERKFFGVFGSVQGEAQTDLTQIREATDFVRFGFCFAHCREQERGKYRDDCNHDEQFDKCKSEPRKMFRSTQKKNIHG